MSKTRRCSAALLALLMLAATACGGEAADTGTTASASGGETQAAVGYDYGGKNYGGYEFKVLSFDKYVSYIDLDFAEYTGESLDDAVYDRNRKVEDALNFRFKEVETPYTGWKTGQVAMIDQVIQSVMAGDYAYDAAYLPVAFKAGIITDGYLYDLKTLPGLKLDEEYWDHKINDSLEFGGKLYAASSPLQFQTMDMADVLLFNEDLFTDMKLEYPYQLVRDGKWTLDAMQEYVTALTQLNGDDSFQFNAEGNAQYGIAYHSDLVFAMTASSGCMMAEKTAGGGISLTLENERWHNTVDKLNILFNKTNGHAEGSTNATAANNYISMFRSRRAGFLTAELKATLELRDMNDNFGLLPMPKYDEAQAEYITMTGYSTTLLTVPKTQTDPERTGVILDALSYESWKNVLPVYYDVTIEQKGLRNEDSIEMLDIIREGRTAEFTRVLGITNTYVTSLYNMILSGSNTLASLAASNKTALETSIKTVVDAMAK